jgi:hypothetical protein
MQLPRVLVFTMCLKTFTIKVMIMTASHLDPTPWVSIIKDTARHGNTVAAETLSNIKWDITLPKRICSSFDADFAKISTHDFLFNGEIPPAESNALTVQLLQDWLRAPESSTNLVALCAVASEHFGITDTTFRSAITMAALLGEIENNDDFHNNMHFRKVLLQTIRMITAHNHLYAGTDMILSAHEISTLLIAACIHDLAHNGKVNFAGGEHYPGYLEQQSFNTACPYLEEVGFNDPADLGALNVMVLATDVSSSVREPLSFYEQMKLAYLHHFVKPQDDLNFSDPMIELQNPRTALLAAILHESDIATSAGISYEVSQVESRLLAMETGISVIGTPQGLTTFLEQMCCGGMVVEAGRHLYQENMDSILKQARYDIDHNNNAPFPAIKCAALLKI